MNSVLEEPHRDYHTPKRRGRPPGAKNRTNWYNRNIIQPRESRNVDISKLH